MTPDEVAEARWDSGGDDGEDAVMERQALEAGPASPVVGGDERPDTVEMRYSAQAVEDTMRNGQGDDAAAFLREAADWIDAQPAPSAPTPVSDERRLTREQVADAIQDAWDSFVGDTGCIPDGFTIHGPRTTTVELRANVGNWVGWITDDLNRRLAAAPSPTDGARCPTCTHELAAHRKVSKGAGCVDCGCTMDAELVLGRPSPTDGQRCGVKFRPGDEGGYDTTSGVACRLPLDHAGPHRTSWAARPAPAVEGEQPAPKWVCQKPGWMGLCSPQSTHHNGFDWGCGWFYSAAPPGVLGDGAQPADGPPK